MSGLLELYKTRLATTKPAQANTKGVDPEPIGDRNAFKPSRDLVKDAAALTKGRKGTLGSGTPRGYAPGKGYSSTKRD
jgi:hypothetical protein